MDDLKCKKEKVDNKKKDLLMKLQGKVKKKRKSKKKENFKRYKSGATSTWRMQKGVRMLGAKERKGFEGMFFKGLRSEYITRETLNEANEARKNEDLNKIIDIGRDFLGKMEESAKSSSLTREKVRKVTEPKRKERKPSLEEELESFSLKYEETAKAQVLLRLPGSGILEEALEALRKVSDRLREPEKVDREKSIESSNEFKFSPENFEVGVEGKEIIRDFISPEEVICSESESRDSVIAKTYENWFVMNDSERENCNDEPLTTVFSFEEDERKVRENARFIQEKNFDKPVKDLNVSTPPIHFYRRNMF